MSFTKKYMDTSPMPTSAGTPGYDIKSCAAAAMSAVSRGSWGVAEMLKARKELHRAAECEKEFSEEVLDAERTSASILRSHGVENRYSDALSKAAGTYVKNPRPATMQEALMYLEHMGLDTMPILLGQDMESGEMFADIRNPMLKSAAASIIKGMNRHLPENLALKPITKQPGEDPQGFVRICFPFQLQLLKREFYGDSDFHVTTKGALSRGLKTAAAEASAVFKSSTDVPFRLIKGGKEEPVERIVTAVVLEPETPDATKTKETEADIYSEEEIRKAMHWWMENSGSTFSYYHKNDGGWNLNATQVKLLENWQTRVDQTIGTQLIKKGSWVATARICDDTLWEVIVKGEITGWSVGMWALGEVEEVAADA